MVLWSLSKQGMLDLTGGGSELKMAKKSFLFQTEEKSIHFSVYLSLR